jgi:hypothetical protein
LARKSKGGWGHTQSEPLRRAHLAIPIAGLHKFEADMDYTMLEKGHSAEIVTAAGSNLGKVFDSALRDLATV